MGWDDLEPGQDDLVKEDKAMKNIVRKVKGMHLTDVSDDEALYTDHKAGDPAKSAPPERAVAAAGSGTSTPGRSRFSDMRKALKQARESVSGAFGSRDSKGRKPYRGG